MRLGSAVQRRVWDSDCDDRESGRCRRPGLDAVKASRADDFGGDFAKEAFHQIEPGVLSPPRFGINAGVLVGGALNFLVRLVPL